MTSRTLCCEQCGRTGTRQFEVQPAGCVPFGPNKTDLVWLDECVQCSNKAACYKRWPKSAKDDD